MCFSLTNTKSLSEAFLLCGPSKNAVNHTNLIGIFTLENLFSTLKLAIAFRKYELHESKVLISSGSPNENVGSLNHFSIPSLHMERL